MLLIISGAFVSYLIGSIPTAYIFGRLLKGIDIRNFGSGNIGATNALRVLGKRAGITVLVLDVLKGFIAVVFLGNLIASKTAFIPEGTLRLILGLCCICGHNWTIFLKFKGGKGIATTFGVLLGLSVKIAGLKLVLVLIILTWVLTFIITRIVSVASIVTGISLPLYMLVFKQSKMLLYLSLLLCVFVILRHKSNLKRILKGKEPRLNLTSK
ncbi:MAG: glycerol-3-phosphate 1-O-acyltransferase PlsY [Candidatus Omnitrophota bacterium]